MHVRGKTKGFTLIELLVVIAIIALLVSILLPSLNKAKQLAKKTVCLSQLKSIGLTVAMYASANNDCFPVSRGTYSGNLAAGGTYHWYNLLSPYAGEETQLTYDVGTANTSGGVTYYGFSELFKGCPEYDAKAAAEWNPGYGVVVLLHWMDNQKPTSAASTYRNYFNMLGSAGGPYNPSKDRFYRRSEFADPSRRGWIGDSPGWHIGGGVGTEYNEEANIFPSWAPPIGGGPNSSETGDGFITGVGLGRDPIRHGEVSNIWFIDGHAKDYKYDVGGHAFCDYTKLPIK